MRADVVRRAVERLDAIDGSDPERAHAEADDALLFFVDAEIAAAYERAINRCGWWASA